MRIEIVKESVVFQKTDAIVNAANATMLGGGAVDGAIHDAAGPELYEFFNRQRKMCDTLALARYFRPDLKSHALGNLLGPLGVDGVNSHDALDDVMACAGVFFKLMGSRVCRG